MSRIDLAVDVRGIYDGFKGGIGEYTQEVLTRMSSSKEYTLHPVISGKRAKIQSRKSIAGLKPYHLDVPNKVLNTSLILRKKPYLDQMITPPVQGMYMPNLNITSLSSDIPLVLTVHDLSFEIFPEVFSRKMQLWHRLINPQKLLQRAQGIIADSESTAQDIVDIYNIARDKIHIAHPGVDAIYYPQMMSEKRKTELRDKYNLPKKFFLYLGTVEPRKNIRSLVRAFESIASDFSDTDLVIAGKTGWLAEQSTQEIRSSAYRDRIHRIGFVDAIDKPDLYRLAHIFVYPSYYEGFGFPPIEAMACGIPTITSHTSSLPEVVEESAWKVSPYDSDELAWSMKEMMQNNDIYNKYARKGPIRAKKFTWEETIQKIDAVFHRCFL